MTKVIISRLTGNWAMSLLPAAVLLAAPRPGIGADVTATWQGASGSWSDPLNWDSAAYPHNGNGAATYDVVVTSGAADIPALTNIIIESLNLSGGQIGGQGSLQLNAASTWSSGTLAGGAGGFTLRGAGPLNVVSSGSIQRPFGGTINNQGTLVWQGGSYITPDGGNDDTFVNSGLVQLNGFGSSFSPQYGQGSVVNQAGGVIRGNAVGGAVSIDLPVDNDGTIEVDAGELRLAGGGSSSGVFDIAAGAVLDLSGNFTLDDGASSVGDGVVRFASGTLQSTGVAHIKNLEFSGGTLSGVTLAAGSNTTLISTGSIQRLFSGTVTNQGTLVWQGSSYITPDGGNDDTFVNSGLVQLNGFGSSFSPQYGQGSLVNQTGGVIRGNAVGGAVSIDLPIDNDGTIEVDAGELRLSGGGSSSGVFDIAAGSVLELAGAFTLEDGASAIGDGAVRFSSGTLQSTGVAHIENLEFTGGTITGAFQLDGNLLWNGSGTLSGATLTAGSNTTVVGGYPYRFVGGTVTNQGTFVWQGGTYITPDGGNDDTFVNTGLVDLQGDGGGFSPQYGQGTVVNQAGGVIRRSTGTGTASLDLAVENAGTIDVLSGSLQSSGVLTNAGRIEVGAGATASFAGGGSSSGVFEVAAGGTLNLAGNFTLEDGASGEGDGVIRFTNGTLQTTGVVHFQNLELTGGTITGPLQLDGNLLWNGGGTLSGTTLTNGSNTTVVGGYPYRFFGGTVTNQGTFVWQGGSYVTPDGGNDDTFVNTGLVDLQGDGGSFSPQYGQGTIVNQAGGVIRRSASSGSASIDLPIDNDGTIDVDTGQLKLSGGSSSGVFNIAADAVLDLSGNFTLEDGASAAGDGVVRFTSGTLQSTGVAHIENLDFSGGTITGAFQLNGNLLWGGSGSLIGATLTPGSTTTVVGGGYPYRFFGGTVTNQGTFVWQGGNYITPDGGNDDTFVNIGVVDLQGDGGSFSPQIGLGTLVNQAGGVIRRSTGAGTAQITLPLTNDGTIEALSGTFDISGGLSSVDVPTQTLTTGVYRAVDQGSGATLRVYGGSSAIVTIASGATVELSGADSHMHFDGTEIEASLANNAGALKILNGRDLVMTGALNNSGRVELGGASLAGGELTTSGDIVNAAGGEISGHGAVHNTILSSGAVRAAGGTLAVVGGLINGSSGTVKTDAGATLDLSGATGNSSAGLLVHNGAGLNLGNNALAVSTDYQNASFGVGNSFNARAHVTGSGAINASPGVAQTLSGNLTGGATPTALMNFGTVHVGDAPTRVYQINSVGAGGPSLRGAIQTTVGGAALSDPRLTGAGVTASNFGPVAAGGNSGNLAVTFNATTAGPLAGQQVRIVNNFDNVAEQTLQFAGTAYRYAAPTHTPEPVNFGIIHVGDVAAQALTISNTAANDGYSERLSASIGGATGHATTNGGSLSGLAPGASNNTSLTVGLNTATAGLKSGTATLSLTSTGAGTSGLADTTLTNQTVSVQAQVNNFAAPKVVKLAGGGTLTLNSATSASLDLGATFVGKSALSATLGILNDVAAPADDLAGSFTSSAPDFVLGGLGAFDGLAAGATRGGLSIALNTTTPGDYSGQITLAPQSTNPRPFSMNLSPVTIDLTGVIYAAEDFNADGQVDGLDLAQWRNSFGPAGGADADFDGDSDGADFLRWQRAAASGGSVASASQATPEPQSLALVAWAAAARVLVASSRRAGGRRDAFPHRRI